MMSFWIVLLVYRACELKLARQDDEEKHVFMFSLQIHIQKQVMDVADHFLFHQCLSCLRFIHVLIVRRSH